MRTWRVTAMQSNESEFPPSGCRHCGLGPRLHFQRWTNEAGWHVFTEPTREQILERLRAKYASRLTEAKASAS